MNSRFSGGIPLSIEAGCDLVQNLIEWYLGEPLTKFAKLKDGLIMMKYEQEANTDIYTFDEKTTT